MKRVSSKNPAVRRLSDSEINISPVEGTAEGKIVSDVSIMSVGVTLYDLSP